MYNPTYMEFTTLKKINLNENYESSYIFFIFDIKTAGKDIFLSYDKSAFIIICLKTI